MTFMHSFEDELIKLGSPVARQARKLLERSKSEGMKKPTMIRFP